jgi:hypothetical protein
MPQYHYRIQARAATGRAQALLATGVDDQLRYAALELRLAMEALTYDRAQAYLKELQIEALAKWQPKQLMDALIEIDSTAGSTYTVRVGEEPSPGATPERMSTLGTDTVFGLEEIKAHYHATGSFLHMPTMKQLGEGKGWDPAKTRARLDETAQKIEASLNSPIWNFTLGNFSDFECLRCDKLIHKRVPLGQEKLVAKCIYCNAPHAGRRLDDGTVQWEAMTAWSSCPTPNCEHGFGLWLDEIKQGTCWKCPECHKRFRVDYGVVPDDAPGDVLPHDNLI